MNLKCRRDVPDLVVLLTRLEDTGNNVFGAELEFLALVVCRNMNNYILLIKFHLHVTEKF